MNRTELNRAIYLKARRNCSWKNSEEAVRTVRDSAVSTVTLHTRGERYMVSDYKLLTMEELQGVADYLDKGQSVLEGLAKNSNGARNQYATAKQKKTMFYHVLSCAVFYADTSISFTDTNTGEILEGEALKQWRCKCFDNGTALPSGIMQTLYEWAVPKVWQLLVEGGFRRLPKGISDYKHDRLKKIAWNEISREEADAIIKHFRAMNATIESKYKFNKRTTYYG